MPISQEDVAFWESQCLPSFSSLLNSTGSYTPDQQQSHIRFFKDHVIPHLGPKPTSGGAYLLAHTGSVLENSTNFSDKCQPVIRFIFQPMGIEGIPEAIGADMDWFHQTASVFCLSEEEQASLKAKVPQLSSIPQYLIGFDLEPESRALKAYFAPMYKHILHGVDTDKLIYDLVRRLNPLGDALVTALTKIEDFRAEEPQRPVDCIGIDCIKPSDGARFKLYTRLPQNKNNWSFLAHQMTLGGRLAGDETLQEGLALLKGIWHLLFDEAEGFAEEDRCKQENQQEGPHFGLLLSWELQPGKDAPIPKLYVPLWKFASSNKSIGENYVKIFQKWGWAWGEDGKYMKEIEKA